MICCPSAEKFSKQMEQDAECPSGLSSSKSRASNGTTSSCSNKPSGAALGLRGKRTKPRVTKKNIRDTTSVLAISNSVHCTTATSQCVAWITIASATTGQQSATVARSQLNTLTRHGSGPSLAKL
eukprot:CAMPEP_0178468358 /NCGR_PEP_ID=MMETSP0689_2-20121128/52877_1 /TAXON_ID=160604 /ORGANISM="Amphidinium massartii, Strain CS-259" /LENGTH=124 /DNA_ID=CAMNT_0020095409 /DNA_START=118 /DNA_END=492 /DNA_ORIENTATION=-